MFWCSLIHIKGKNQFKMVIFLLKPYISQNLVTSKKQKISDLADKRFTIKKILDSLLWEAWGPWKEEQSLFEWTTTDHRGKELSKQAELAHCRRSGIVEQSQRGWGWENYFAVETKPNGLTEFIQEPVGRCNWSASKWCLGLKVWNWAEAAQNNSDVYLISLGKVTGSRLTHSIRTILPF